MSETSVAYELAMNHVRARKVPAVLNGALFALSQVGFHGGMADSTFDIVSKVDPIEAFGGPFRDLALDDSRV